MVDSASHAAHSVNCISEPLLAMQVFNASEELYKAQTCICLIVGTPFQHSVQQLPASQQLCDEVHLVALLKVLFQENDILVVHAHQNVNLLEDVFPANACSVV